ncbi:MAG TPA: hypothetical protein EYM79_08995 [Planctomycetes bacterium]|nr:hypothetical protein [Planctomycetaceae bacterium]HIN54436.1 hypothetical protein [Planctomycetota bacterium]
MPLAKMKPVIRTIAITVLLMTSSILAVEKPAVHFDVHADHIAINVGDKTFATYVFANDKITRPFFAHVHAPNAVQVTRNHPPQPADSQDHATMHPGIWMAFGDISGHDFWRLKAPVVHHHFVVKPTTQLGGGTFTVENHYMATNSRETVCVETCRYDILVRPTGYLLICSSAFTSNHDFYFGDQEEMGMAMRVATPLAVVNGGRILNSKAQRNEKGVWGKQADWADYSGTREGTHLGMTLMADPNNFRRSWFHARDYGFIAANPFGVNAFTGGEKSKIHVKAGKSLRIRFGVFVHSNAQDKTDHAANYRDFLNQLQ